MIVKPVMLCVKYHWKINPRAHFWILSGDRSKLRSPWRRAVTRSARHRSRGGARLWGHLFPGERRTCPSPGPPPVGGWTPAERATGRLIQHAAERHTDDSHAHHLHPIKSRPRRKAKQQHKKKNEIAPYLRVSVLNSFTKAGKEGFLCVMNEDKYRCIIYLQSE